MDNFHIHSNIQFFHVQEKNLKVNLPSISGGLNKAVKNRYLLPIASTTISTSNGKLYNSYGYSD